ncbi:hypothetical protein PoB_002716000 [Plakobranchus ocellatus]|uniref:Uncharacterized protein n=1 Tax=Plakobranchus ocellatus TaxID=259542 RepID=A0AAV3ZXP5_9GAST|nr:hypothetical protein PoB_002716000 [Plakobranchus ocellatus]
MLPWNAVTTEPLSVALQVAADRNAKLRVCDAVAAEVTSTVHTASVGWSRYLQERQQITRFNLMQSLRKISCIIWKVNMSVYSNLLPPPLSPPSITPSLWGVELQTLETLGRHVTQQQVSLPWLSPYRDHYIPASHSPWGALKHGRTGSMTETFKRCQTHSCIICEQPAAGTQPTSSY